jgi:hypothetical protein
VFQLRFHDVHGANISLSANGHVVERLQGYGKGLVFSSRPVKVNEKISIKLLKLSNQLSSTICFGFTSKNPNTLSDDLHYSYLDVFKLGCYWIWPLFKTMCVENTVLSTTSRKTAKSTSASTATRSTPSTSASARRGRFGPSSTSTASPPRWSS